MMVDISEKNLEAAIEAALLAGGPDDPAPASGVQEPLFGDGEYPPGGYRRRKPEDYDRALCLDPGPLFDFIYATQPVEWDRLKKQHGDDARQMFAKRVASEVAKRGTLDVLRNGVKDSGCRFQLAYFRPATGLNATIQKLYEANVFTVVRQLHYSDKDAGKSLDMALFLNGLPLFTAELKNPLTGQNVQNAMTQYRKDRDPHEPLFAFGRCLAHFAVDPDLVYMTTHLQGADTRFLPFNRGRDRGAGNPPVWQGFATAYLWERVWARDSVLNLVQHFIQMIEVEDDKGRKTGKRRVIFPRYHQLDAVRRLIADAKDKGAGQRYLIQHSAGSGKSNSIAWLAHQLSVLHDDEDRRVFDSIIVITDRRVLDRQLQATVRQFQQTLGIVENIDKTSRQLREALETGKTIVVTTLQKFPVIAGEMGALPGKRFAVIVDEAHSSQSGESTKSLKTVLDCDSLEEAADKDAPEADDLEDRIAAEMASRGRLPNVSWFAFTATPKNKTLELFGSPKPGGKDFEAFSLYSMRQAIEEGFILDVLQNYTTYHAYWNLLKKAADDPRVERAKAATALRWFVELHAHTVGKKARIMVAHFHEHVAHRIGGKAKAMVVTRSRLHAVRYRQAIDEVLKENGYPYRALVAFSGTVRVGGVDYTETAMNGIPETQTAATFRHDDYRFLVVANKFQTGFDEPLLHTMYVDKKLGNVNAVQTLSRLNRTHPGKAETMVLDFANEAAEIQEAFKPYYEKTLLAEATNANVLYDKQRRLLEFGLYTEAEVDAFAAVYFDPKGTQDRLHALLAPVIQRYSEIAVDVQADFRGTLKDYVRLYAFLSQVISWPNANDLEKLYAFARLLARKLPIAHEELPAELMAAVDLDSYRLDRTQDQKSISLPRGDGVVKPIDGGGPHGGGADAMEALSAVIAELNKRFGTNFTEADKVFIASLEQRLADDEAVAASVKVNPPENARLTFDHVVGDIVQSMMDTNFRFYKQINDDPEFAKFFVGWLFDRYTRGQHPGQSKM
jgi:type I restriction enzyme R subunit